MMERIHQFIRADKEVPENKVILKTVKLAGVDVLFMSVLQDNPAFLPRGVYLIPKLTGSAYESDVFEHNLKRDLNGWFLQLEGISTAYRPALQIIETRRSMHVQGTRYMILQVKPIATLD